MRKAEKEYFQNMTDNISTLLITVSKGKAWIEWDDKKGIKLTGLTEKDVEQAGIIQLMFSQAIENKSMDVEKVQAAFDYFRWDVVLRREGDAVDFTGHDRFILVQITRLMGGMDSKQYAKMYREAIENNERIYF